MVNKFVGTGTDPVRSGDPGPLDPVVPEPRLVIRTPWIACLGSAGEGGEDAWEHASSRSP